MNTALAIPSVAYRSIKPSHRKDFVEPPSRYYLNSSFDAPRVVKAMTRLYFDMCMHVARINEWIGFERSFFLTHGCAAASRGEYGIRTCHEAENGLYGLLEAEWFRIEIRPDGAEIVFPTSRLGELLTLREDLMVA